MKENNSIKISLSTFFLIITIIVIVVMGYIMYKLYNDKVNETNKANVLQKQVNSLNATVYELNGNINCIADAINNNDKKAETKIESDKAETLKTETSNAENIKTESKKEDSNYVQIKGTYSVESKTEDYYSSAQLIVSNQTNNSIKFSISVAHGRDINNVNIGEIEGTANKINVPDNLEDPNAIQYAYQFVDGNNKIILVYTNHRGIEYFSISEDYANDSNPYGGAGVYFSGDYEKIK